MYEVNGKKYKILESYYRTNGSKNQMLYTTDSVTDDIRDYLYTERIFHLAQTELLDIVFIKEYFSLKEAGKACFDIISFLYENNKNIICPIDYEDGKVVMEFFVGRSMLRQGMGIPIKRAVEILDDVCKFILFLQSNKMDNLFEVSPNDIIISNYYPYNYKIVDFESDPTREKEFMQKNEKFFEGYNNMKEILEKRL